jgi:hypothetical protein
VKLYQVSRFVADNVEWINSGSKVGKYIQVAEIINR